MGLKLRNKKTGEIGELLGTDRAAGIINICINFHDGKPKAYNYESLAELNEEWEDYKPTEPLIKDEKIRKCVKLWLEINEIYSVTYRKRRGGGSYLELDNMPMRNGCCIIFQDLIEELEDEQVYTFEELCGEEEE